MTVYNIGLIGCGYMGQTHLMDIAAKANIRIYALCDRDRQRADSLAARYGASRVYDDAMELISDPEVDIVIIATYPSSHLALLKACLEKGKHVLCEKPVADNLEDGREFVKAVKEAPRCKVLVGYILRHNETYNKVKELIDEGLIGKPMILRMVQNHNTLRNWEKYRILIEETSPIVDCGVHYIDVMRWFTEEEVVSVDGVGAVTEPGLSPGTYNYGMIQVTLSGGSVGFYEAGWSNSIATDSFKEFVGPKGRIRITYQTERTDHREDGNLVSIYRHSDGTTEHINIPFTVKPTGVQMDHLIAMIEKDIPANPTMEDVFCSFAVACEADRKIREKMK